MVHKKKVFLEKFGEEWLDDFVYMSRVWLERMGLQIVPFDASDPDEVRRNILKHNPTKEDYIFGSVEATTLFYELVGIQVPEYLGYPDKLQPFMHRSLKKTTVGEIDMEYPYFVKPAKGVKKFTGCVVENAVHLGLLHKFYEVTDEDEIFISSTVDFESEYRCFVHKGEVKGIQLYYGDFRQRPDISVIDNMVQLYEDAPVSYTLDVGVLDTGETALVEINDMWAIGAYGFDARKYVRMCLDRHNEIRNTSKIEQD